MVAVLVFKDNDVSDHSDVVIYTCQIYQLDEVMSVTSMYMTSSTHPTPLHTRSTVINLLILVLLILFICIIVRIMVNSVSQYNKCVTNVRYSALYLVGEP